MTVSLANVASHPMIVPPRLAAGPAGGPVHSGSFGTQVRGMVAPLADQGVDVARLNRVLDGLDLKSGTLATSQDVMRGVLQYLAGAAARGSDNRIASDVIADLVDLLG